MLEHALTYAKRGWPVLPLHWVTKGLCSCKNTTCKSPGKHPLTPSGLGDASTNKDQVETWWSRWPDANIGCATGEFMGAWVLDIDGPVGSASLTQLEEEIGPLPETLEQQTGGGGRHLFFCWPGGEREARNKQAFRPGVDVRGNGGYVVVPPSVHQCGRKYDWPNGQRGKIAEAPLAWLELLAPVKRPVPPWERVDPKPVKPRPPRGVTQAPVAERARLYLATVEPAVQGNGGHNSILWAARALVVGFELDDATAIDLLWSDFNPRCQPPWDPDDPGDRRDFERKVGEARRTPGTKPSGWLLDELGIRDTSEQMEQLARGRQSATFLLAEAEVDIGHLKGLLDERTGNEEDRDLSGREPFPLEHFPARLEAFARSVAESHVVDESWAGLPMLAAAGACMGNAYRLRNKEGYEAPPILWVILVGDSGANKSGPLRVIMDPIEKDVQFDDSRDDDLANPPQPEIQIEDATVEAVAARLSGSPRGLLVYRDEVAAWAKSFGEFKAGRGGDEQAWLKFWNGATYKIDRKTNDERTRISAAAVSLVGGIQPRVMCRVFDPDKFSSGLVPRILVSCPPLRTRFWTERVVNQEERDHWERVTGWLRTRPFRYLDSDEGVYKPWVLNWDKRARAIYVNYFDDLASEYGGEGDENCRAMLSKAQETTARMALIHHGLLAASYGEKEIPQEVGMASVEAGIAWTHWCVHEQRRLYKYSKSESRQDLAERLVTMIRHRRPTQVVTARDLHVMNRRLYPKAKAARATMGWAVDAGLAKWSDPRKRGIVLVEGAGV